MPTVRKVEATDIFCEHANRKFLYTDDNICPICSYSSNELTAEGYYSLQSNATHFYVLKACPYCRKISLYKASVSNSSLFYSNDYYDLTSVYFFTDCQEDNVTEFGETINKISPDFVRIFNQSKLAERNGYNEICGMGYRKSLEFLIKDYLCETQPENSETIKIEPLSQSIKRISEKRIKTLAERCAWIGNDETHYTRKHEDYDINTLKIFINSVIHYIEAEFAFFSALEIQPK